MTLYGTRRSTVRLAKVESGGAELLGGKHEKQTQAKTI